MSRIISLINAALLIIQTGLAIYIITTRSSVPEHWNITGEIDSYGNPVSIIILPILSAFIWGMIIFAIRHPQYINLPPSVKDKSRAIATSCRLLSACSLWVMVMTTYICICVLCIWSMTCGLVILIGSLVALIIYYCIKLYRD